MALTSSVVFPPKPVISSLFMRKILDECHLEDIPQNS